MTVHYFVGPSLVLFDIPFFKISIVAYVCRIGIISFPFGFNVSLFVCLSLGKEASSVLRSYGWTEEVDRYMCSRKKVYSREAGEVESDNNELK